MSAGTAVIGIIGGLAIVAVIGKATLGGNGGSVSVPVYVAPNAPVLALQPPEPVIDHVKERAAYERDREAVRKAKPKTEAEVTKLIGRKPDNIIEMPNYSMIQWYYQSQPVTRDVLQITTENGRITIMSL